MRPSELLVGLDVGTTSCKAVVFDDAGVARSVGRARTPWRQVEPADPTGTAGTEMDAGALLLACVTAVHRALAEAPPGRVAGLGVTSMAESGVLLDARGQPVVPVVAWHDARDHIEVVELGRDLDENRFSSRTGLPYRSQWSLTKHRWQLANDPQTAGATRRLSVAEWVVHALGGDQASDASLASRTGWLDLSARTWWGEAIAWSGASESLFPPLVTSGSALGSVSSAAGVARLTGAVLTTAGHDHQAAAVGAEAAGPGDQLDSCGTAEALVRTVTAGFPPAGVFRLAKGGVTVGWHVLDGRWALLGATEGGLELQRTLATLGGPEALPSLDAAALGAIAHAGKTPPTRDPTRTAARSVAGKVSSGQVWKAALEDITSRIHRIDHSITAVVGPYRSMVVTGGWSRSPALMEVKRRTFGDLRRSDVEEAGARGAALLAGVAAGTYAGINEFPRLS